MGFLFAFLGLCILGLVVADIIDFWTNINKP